MDARLLIISIVPSIILALWIYFHDKYDREPLGLVIKTFFYGTLIIFPTLYIEKFLLSLNVFNGLFGSIYTAFIVAGLTEEFFKRLIVLKTIYHHEEFNERLDGIAYSVYAALGFATIENIMYVTNNYFANPLVGLYRGIFSVPAHILFAITMGYYLSLAKFCGNVYDKKRYLSKSLWIPVIFHGIFNFILLSKISILMVIFIPFVIYLWIINIRKLKEYTKESKMEHMNYKNK
jgi:RsiW-degrading membrane proteinase PrsW (M82 family)